MARRLRQTYGGRRQPSVARVDPRLRGRGARRKFRAGGGRARHDGGVGQLSRAATRAASSAMPLFRRHAQRVELTQSGAVIAREAMNAFAALRASFVRAVDVDESRLALTTLPTFGTSWLTPRLGEFRQREPGISLRIDVSGDAEDLNDGRFDAAIRNGHGRWPGMRAVKLLPSIFMPLCSPEAEERGRGTRESAACTVRAAARPAGLVDDVVSRARLRRGTVARQVRHEPRARVSRHRRGRRRTGHRDRFAVAVPRGDRRGAARARARFRRRPMVARSGFSIRRRASTAARSWSSGSG